MSFFELLIFFFKSVVRQKGKKQVPIEGSKDNNITYEKA